MSSYPDYPFGVIADALCSVWVRLLAFIAAVVGGAELAAMIRWDTGFYGGLMLILVAPFAWLVFPIYLVADIATVAVFFLYMRSESTPFTVISIALAFGIWLSLGLLLWK